MRDDLFRMPAHRPMLTARHIHALLLGVILGSASAYVYASARTGAERDALAQQARSRLVGGAPADHPEVTGQAMLEMFAEAVASNPNDPRLLTEYATLLFDARRFAEAAGVFDRVLAETPDDAEVRTYMATSLYAAGQRERAMVEFETALEDDPNQILALHNLSLGHLDLNNDPNAAQEVLSRIEGIDPNYEGLASLRSRINAARAD
jgi:Flp pilus assembly protein TadD